MCPGRQLTLWTQWLTIASTLSIYNIHKPIDKNGKEVQPDFAYIPGLLQWVNLLKCVYLSSYPALQNASGIQLSVCPALWGSWSAPRFALVDIVWHCGRCFSGGALGTVSYFNSRAFSFISKMCVVFRILVLIRLFRNWTARYNYYYLVFTNMGWSSQMK